MRFNRLLLLVFSLLLTMASFSQSVLHYQFTHISQNEGLSSTYVRTIVQDPFGFIWAGTQDGLNRYDGRKIITFNKDKSISRFLSGSDIRDIVIDTIRNSIWVLTSYGGINAIDYRTGTTWYTFEQQKNSALSKIVFNCFFFYENSIYIGSTAGLYKLEFKNGNFPHFLKAEQTIQNPAAEIDKVIVKEKRYAWLFTRIGNIIGVDMESKKVLSDTKINLNDSVRTLDACLLLSGEILLATSKGLKLITTSGPEPIVRDDPFNYVSPELGNIVFACFQEKGGRIWLSDARKVIRIDPVTRSFEVLRENSSSTNEDWIGAVYSIMVDRQDNLWLGCHQGLAYGINRVSPFYRMTQSVSSTDRMEHIFHIDPKSDSIAMASGQNGLFYLNMNTGYIVNIFKGQSFYHSFTGPAGESIVTNGTGNFILRHKELVPLNRIYKEFADNSFILNSHLKINDSTIVLGSRNFKGIMIWSPKKKSIRIINEQTKGLSLGDNVINALCLDKKGNVWVLGDRSITILDGKLETKRIFTPASREPKKTYSLFFDMYDDGTHYYIASYGNGIVKLNQQLEWTGELNSGKELTSNSTYKLLPYRDSLLFVTTNNGLSIIDLLNNNQANNYSENDGLQSNSFEENTGAVLNNRIYIGGSRGMTVVKPELLHSPAQLIPLYLDNIRIDLQNGKFIDTSNILLTSFEIPNNATQTTLSFSTPVYTQTGAIEYQYRVDELHENWIDIGKRNVISFIGLAPGSYTVNVRTRYPSEKWPDQYLSINLKFKPKWYQTLAFNILVILLLGGAILLLYKYRISQIKKQEQIRKNFATDLHDDIGSNLNSIKIFTHLAIRDQKRADHLANIEDSLTQTTIGLRDMIWVLDDTNDSPQALMERIRRFAHPLCLAKNIELNCLTEPVKKEEKIGKSEKRNLLLISKEVINNSIKYSNCKVITVRLSFQGKTKLLTISDDGAGFDTAKAYSGNGLKNIQHRVSQLRWKLWVESNQNGTVFSLSNV